MKILFFFYVFILTLNCCNAQDSTVYTDSTRAPYPKLPSVWEEVIITENKTRTKFILDSSRVIIKAVDSSGKILWITNPYIDNQLKEMNPLEAKPIIIQFYFRKDKFTNYTVEIFICYNIGFGLYGLINLNDGKFTFLGAR